MDNTRKIKILYIIDQLFLMGGTERQLILLADNLPRKDFQPVIAELHSTERATEFNLTTPCITFDAGKIPIVKNLRLIYQLRQYIQREKFDIIQTNFEESAIYGAVAAWLASPSPIIITTRRNLYHWLEDSRWMLYALRFADVFTDCILSNSIAVSKKCKAIEKVNASKIKVIQNAVEIGKFDQIPRKDARKRLGFTEKHYLIGVVGNWRPVKGLNSFLKAAAIIKKQIPSSRFILAGYGPQEEELRILSDYLGIKDSVVFYKKPDNVSEIMAALDIAVQPSLSESFSNVLVEYMAARLPIVATRVGDAENIITGGEEGLLVRPDNPEEMAESIANLYKNSDEAKKMAEKAWLKVKKNWASEKILDEYYTFYKDLLA